MRYYFDTEFLEDGRTIDLISIGIVSDDGREYYACSIEADWDAIANDKWLRENVLPLLNVQVYVANGRYDVMIPPGIQWKSRSTIAQEVHEFCTYCPKWDVRSDIPHSWIEEYHIPEFWTWYGAYDWVALCQLYGRMIDLPKEFPQYCNDFKQKCREHNLQPTKPKVEHHALFDAIWLRDQMEQLGPWLF